MMSGNPDENKDIRYLIWGAGGTSGIAFAGAVYALYIIHERKLVSNFNLDHIKDVAGVSAGVVVALAMALGLNAEQMIERLIKIPLEDMADTGSILECCFRLFTKRTLCAGKKIEEQFLNLLREYIPDIPPEKVTFADFKAKGFLNLHISASRLVGYINPDSERRVSTYRPKIYSYEATPNATLLEAIKASMAIPIFYPQCIGKDKGVLSDGAIATGLLPKPFNYPKYLIPEEQRKITDELPEVEDFELFNPKRILSKHNPHVLSIGFKHPTNVTYEPVETSSPGVNFDAMINSILSQAVEHEKRAHPQQVILLDKDIGTTQFSASEAIKKRTMRKAFNEVFEHFGLPVNEEDYHEYFKIKPEELESTSVPKTHPAKDTVLPYIQACLGF